MRAGFATSVVLPLRAGGRAVCGRRAASRAARRRGAVVALFGRKPRQPQGFALGDAPEYLFADLAQLEAALGKPGAYAVRDQHGTLQYVGYAKDVHRRLVHHARAVPRLCVYFHTYVPAIPKQDVTPDLLEGVLEYWVAENGGMPAGNTEHRALWESFGQTTTTTTTTTETAKTQTAVPDPTIPVRERSTPKRRAARSDAANVGSVAGVGVGVGVGAASGGSESWGAREEDVVELNVDPLDPFTATKHAATTREGLWQAAAGDGDGEDWLPIFGVVGVASIIWLLSVLGNALPTASPSLGM